MTNRELINQLLDYPMDFEVAIGLEPENESDEDSEDENLDLFAINSANIFEVKTENSEELKHIIVLHFDEIPDINLN